MTPEEELLTGGNVAGRVVRIGATVRKPAGPATPAVSALLGHLAAAGFDGSPRDLGLDPEGRQVLEFIPGPVAHDLPPLTIDGLHRVGRLIRRLHDTARSFRPPPGAQWDVAIPPDRRDLICHHDLAPWNLVCGPDRWVFIDWDGAGPGSRLWDLGYAVAGFVPLAPGGDPGADGPRMRALADGYGWTPSSAATCLPRRPSTPAACTSCCGHRPSPGPSRGPGCTPRATAITGARPPTTSAVITAPGSPRCSDQAGPPARRTRPRPWSSSASTARCPARRPVARQVSTVHPGGRSANSAARIHSLPPLRAPTARWPAAAPAAWGPRPPRHPATTARPRGTRPRLPARTGRPAAARPQHGQVRREEQAHPR
jgi:Phosphotransferase enzyme family